MPDKSDEEVRIDMGLSKADFYDDPTLSFLLPDEEMSEDLEFIRKYYPTEEVDV